MNEYDKEKTLDQKIKTLEVLSKMIFYAPKDETKEVIESASNKAKEIIESIKFE
jgi:hypothetical protein